MRLDPSSATSFQLLRSTVMRVVTRLAHLETDGERLFLRGFVVPIWLWSSVLALGLSCPTKPSVALTNEWYAGDEGEGGGSLSFESALSWHPSRRKSSGQDETVMRPQAGRPPMNRREARARASDAPQLEKPSNLQSR